MGKEATIESAHLFICSEAHDKASTCSPKQRYIGIVLVVVLFYRVKDSTTAVGVTIAVKVSAHSTGILKLIFMMIGHQLGLASRYLRMGIHIFNKRSEPSRSNLDV